MSIYLICIYFLIFMFFVLCLVFAGILVVNRYIRKDNSDNLKQKNSSLYVKYDLKKKEIIINNQNFLNLDISRCVVRALKKDDFLSSLKLMIKGECELYQFEQEIDGFVIYLAFYFREKIENNVILRCDYTIEKLTKVIQSKNLEDIRNIHNNLLNKSASLYYINIKEFNSINQRYGQKCGDNVLENIKVRLSKIEKNNVYYSYLGRDQFIVYFNNKSINKSKSLKFIKLINKKITKPIDVGCMNIDLNFGIGVCVGNYEELDDFIKRSYVAADYAKKRKKYNIVIYNDNMKLEDDLLDSYEQELNNILTSKEINIDYSPVFYQSKSKFIGYISNPVFSNDSINYESLKTIASQRNSFDRLVGTIIECQLVNYLKKRPKKSSKLFLKLKLDDLPSFLEVYLSQSSYSDCKIVIYLDVKKGYEMVNKFSYISSTIEKIIEEGIEIATELNYSNMYNYDYILKNSTYLILDESIVSNMHNVMIKNKVMDVIELARTYDLNLLAIDVKEYIQFENLLKYNVHYFSGIYFGKNAKKPNEIEQSKTKIFAKFVKDSKKMKKNK